MVYDAHAEILRLAPYCFWDAPIEMAFSIVKRYLRSINYGSRVETPDEKWQHIVNGIQQITPEMCYNCFRHCGYVP